MAILLPEEKDCLDTKIEELTKKQRQGSRDMSEALSQSSETWHDNAPRDVLLDAAKVTAMSLETLVRIQRSAVMGVLEGDEFKVGLGTKFSLEDDHGEKHDYQLTGTGNFLQIPNGLPADSPLGVEVLGKEFYDVIVFKGEEYTINPI